MCGFIMYKMFVIGYVYYSTTHSALIRSSYHRDDLVVVAFVLIKCGRRNFLISAATLFVNYSTT